MYFTLSNSMYIYVFHFFCISLFLYFTFSVFHFFCISLLLYFTSSVFHWYLQWATALCSELQNCRLVISASVTTTPLQQPSHVPLQHHHFHHPCHNYCHHHRHCHHRHNRYHPPSALIRLSSQSSLSPSIPCISNRMSSNENIAMLYFSVLWKLVNLGKVSRKKAAVLLDFVLITFPTPNLDNLYNLFWTPKTSIWATFKMTH